MASKEKIRVHWFRRDLRFHDNTALYYAMQDKKKVLGLFIFDPNILEKLEDKDDARVTFLHRRLEELTTILKAQGSALYIAHGKPQDVYHKLIEQFEIEAVYSNRDYEPYAKERDSKVAALLHESGIPLYSFKDQVIFEKDEIKPDSSDFYKVYTPFKNKWLEHFEQLELEDFGDFTRSDQWVPAGNFPFPSLKDLGFTPSSIDIPHSNPNLEVIEKYDQIRDFPGMQGTTRLGIHLRHGTLSIRDMVRLGAKLNATWLNELIWREFYMMILHHNPQVVDKAFKPAYDQIPWRNASDDFQRWCEGKTGYPIVDAGMRELNQSGYMHNRIRMVTASFLTKHLLIDWRWGEAYFARKLLDFELASNNGGWQWAAGTGTDAQPYFRIFNPYSQTDKFDKNQEYIKKWVPEYGSEAYSKAMIEHKFARERALEVYKKALNT